MLLITTFRKSFKNVMCGNLSLNFLVKKFETWIENFPGNVFPKVIWKSFYFYAFIEKLIE
jgi:hypothetical protein